MDREDKRKIALAVIVILALLGMLFLFLWRTFIDFGTLKVVAEAPYSVEVYGGESYECAEEACEISLRTGDADLILSKEGYRTIVEVAEISLWSDYELKVDFELIPFVEEVESIPEDDVIAEYQLVMDEERSVQKLVRTDDERAEAIVIFQDALEDVEIVGGENAVLLIDTVNNNQAYKIDVRGKERQLISNNNLVGFEEGIWSNNGQYLVFTRQDSDALWLLNGENQVVELNLEGVLDQVAWTYTNNLLFATDFAVADEDRIGEYQNYISVGDTKSSEGISFGQFHPEENSYTLIMTFSNLQRLPGNLVPTSNGEVIYFRVDGVNYRVVIR